ncbi:hypothetical protein [Leuconostoc fallax]|uniref:Uncharacterized protein n=1 Tax=Leuconostoc fallax TaxID=1251 RepID=A0A4R5N773_9LACO|nr:hypothetical protein [Leuconostoc fallax]MBU7455236.1 hypothetical protein [Leuconostoc fallax]TDG67658.1 hypothetical protein C5L23_001457 [Leuconostoc fallax]
MDIYQYMAHLKPREKTYAERESSMFYVYVHELVTSELIKRKLITHKAMRFIVEYTTHGNKTRAYLETHPMASKRTANVNANKYYKRFDVYVSQSVTMYLVHKSRLELAWAIKAINKMGVDRYVNQLIQEIWKGKI